MKDIHADGEVLEAGKDLEEADRAVIMLHGRGATAHSIIQLQRQLPEAAYLAPQAANREWYPRSFMEPREKNQPHLDSALRKVDEIVEKTAESVGKDNVFLLGFSQGACLASEYMASNSEKYGGLFALSGGLIGDEVREFSGNLEETPVFLGCAEKDPHIPLERVEESVEVFKSLNGDVEQYIFGGSQHGVVDYEVEIMNKHIKKKEG